MSRTIRIELTFRNILLLVVGVLAFAAMMAFQELVL